MFLVPDESYNLKQENEVEDENTVRMRMRMREHVWAAPRVRHSFNIAPNLTFIYHLHHPTPVYLYTVFPFAHSLRISIMKSFRMRQMICLFERFY